MHPWTDRPVYILPQEASGEKHPANCQTDGKQRFRMFRTFNAELENLKDPRCELETCNLKTFNLKLLT